MKLTENRGITADHPLRAFAEDPRTANLLYAGTEYGLFVSFDGGRAWQRFPRKLPITPIADLEARDDDLVMPTQGRSVWVVDDVSPLRELSADVTASAAHLFTPAAAVRVQKGSDPFDPQPGLADQPDNGAVLHYWLGAEAKEAVTLEIVDAQRRTVRRYTSDSAASRTARTLPR